MKVEFKTLAYYGFIFFIMIYYGFRMTLVDYSVFNVCLYLAIPCLLFKVIGELYSLKEAIMIFCLVLFGVIETYKMGDTSILISICVMIGMKGIDYNVPLKIIFWMRLIITGIVFALVGMGYIESNVYIREGMVNVVRNSVGYAHPNTLGVYCFVLISLWMLLYNEIDLKIKLIVSVLVSYFIFKVTNSRTSIILNLFFLFLCIISQKISLSKIKKGGVMVIIGVSGFNVVSAMCDTSIISNLNYILNSRLSLGASYFRVYGIHLFGQPIQSIVSESNYWYLDSGWLKLLLSFGLIAFILYLCLSIILCKNTIDKRIIIILIVFSIYGMMENVLSSMLFNYIWVLFGTLLFSDGELKTSSNKSIEYVQ